MTRWMARLGPGSRVLIGICAYVFVAATVLGGAFAAAMALTSDNASSGPSRLGGKIGPGYARMPAADFGKPEKVAYSSPYYPHAQPRGPRTHEPAASVIAAFTAPPLAIGQAEPSAYRRPDIHRFY
jgi:hypothetical protein